MIGITTIRILFNLLLMLVNIFSQALNSLTGLLVVLRHTRNFGLSKYYLRTCDPVAY